jgi:hypothetical protein
VEPGFILFNRGRNSDETVRWGVQSLCGHSVVSGGEPLLGTVHGVVQLVKHLDSVRFVVWLNPGTGFKDGMTVRADEGVVVRKKRE